MKNKVIEMLNKKEIKCRFCNELITYHNDSVFATCDICNTSNEWKHNYVVYKNGCTENLQDYLCDRLDMSEKELLKTMEYELKDRTTERVSNKELVEKYGIEYKYDKEFEDYEYIVVDKEKARNKIVVSVYDDSIHVNYAWRTLGNLLNCESEFEELLKTNWNKYCDSIMLNENPFDKKFDKDIAFFENIFNEIDSYNKFKDIFAWRYKITPIEKINSYHGYGVCEVYVCEVELIEVVSC